MKRKLGAISTVVLTAIFLPAGGLCQVMPYHGGLQARSLINQPVDETNLVALSGNTRAEANAANDRGAVPDSFPMEHMLLQLQRPPELEQAMADLIDAMHKPGSPEFHHWMTPDELGQRFGLSPQDIQTITDWLTSHGFQVNAVFPTGLVIDFSGTAAQVRSAFHTEIHNLNVNGETHISNMRDPQIPAALAGAVKGVVSLHNFMPHSYVQKRPAFDATVSGITYHAVAPGDLATIYNFNPLFAAGLTGVGQTIAVIEDTNIRNASDVATFRSSFGLSGYPGTFSQLLATGSTTCSNPGVNGNEIEAALDAEWAGAAAPGAAIVLAYCADTEVTFGGLIALENLVNGGSPPAIMSISYGECEVQNGASANAAYVQAYQLAAAQGVSVFVSAGDSGAASCDQDLKTASNGITVSGFASTPYNVAVGGTDFSDYYSGTIGTYWNPTNTPTYESAISYIPEIPWNDSCTSDLIFHMEGYIQGYGSTGFCNTSVGHNFLTTSAGSGGPSTYSSQPSWQSIFGLPTASGGPRYLPDVSLFAANGVWGHFYVYCMSDTAENGSPCNYANGADILSNAAGGTSFSSPIMAGIMALVNQKAGAAQGLPNPRIYALAAAEYGTTGSTACNSSLGNGVDSSCFFYDVTLGDMDVPCTGTNSCFGYSHSGSTTTYGALSASTAAFSTAYGTTAGWDFATGIGTVNAYNLVYGWVPASTTTTTTSGLNPAPYGQTVVLTATIASQNYQAITGTVTWSANTDCGTTPVNAGTSGVATCTTSSLPGGSDTVTATYSGDITHTGSSGSVTQQISETAPTVTFTGAPASAPYNSTFTVSATTNASTTASIVAGGACSISGTTVTMTSGTGTCSLTATWAADNNYTLATATQSTTASKIAPTVTFTGAPASAAYNSTFTVSTTTNASTTASILASGACSIAGNTVTMTSSTGTCSLAATWAADNNYTLATATQSTTATSGVTGPLPWPNGYTYRATFTVASGQIGGTLTNFPALINQTVSDWATAANGGKIQNTCTQGAGSYQATIPADLIFTSDSDGSTLLAGWEFESYTASTGASAVWLNVPSIAVGTVVYAWYGNSSVATCQGSVTGTWNSNYMGVWHLAGGTSGGSVTTTTNAIADSTSNGFNGTAASGMTWAGGIFGAGININTKNGIKVTTSSQALNPYPFTTSLWFQSASTAGSYQSLLARGTASSNGYIWQFYSGGSGESRASYYASTSNYVPIGSSVGSGLNSGNWNYLVYTIGSSGSTPYKNGSSLATQSWTGTPSAPTDTFPFYIGYGAGVNNLNATLAEVRISSVALSSSWVAAEYNNQSAPSSFWTVVTGGLSGDGAGPAVTLSAASISFANQVVNTTSGAQTFTIMNTGESPLTISSIAVTGANQADFAQTNNCPTSPNTIAANGMCTVSVTFTPQGASAFMAAVTITDNTANSPQSVNLGGSGVTPPAVTLSAPSISFANQVVNTTSGVQTFTITNTGGSPLTISSIAVTGANQADFAQTNNCPTSPNTIAANGMCTVSVTFTPQGASAFMAAVTITDNAANSPQSLNLGGSGVTPPAVTLSAASISFANQVVNTTSGVQTFTITNAGGSPLTISSIALTGTDQADFAQTNNCPTSPNTIAANGMCTVSVTFTPQGASAFMAAVTITDNAANSPQSLSLGGSGVAGGATWPNGYTYKATFTVASGQIGGTLNNFPALINQTVSDWATAANGGKIQNTCTQGAGSYQATIPADLIFTSDSDGSTLLAGWEFESYTASTGASAVWLNVPSIAVGTVVYAWYGNSSVATCQGSVTGTWNSNYMGVWHLAGGTSGGSVTTTTNAIADSTSNGFNGTAASGMTWAGGIFGAGININTKNGIKVTTSSQALNPYPFTTSLWFQSASTAGSYQSLLARGTASSNGYIWQFYSGGSGESRASYYASTSNYVPIGSSVGSGLNSGNWNYLVYTIGSSGSTPYKNGSSLATQSWTGTPSAPTDTSPFYIGYGAGVNNLNATLAEVRISSVALSSSWVAAEYNNQSAPASFWTVVTTSTPP